MALYGLAGRFSQAQSPCRPNAQESGTFGQAPAARTRCRARLPCGRRARRRAAGWRPGSRGRRWPGGCAGRRTRRASRRRTARPRGRGLRARWRARPAANMATLAVVASRTRVTVPVSGSWRARAVMRGPSVSGQAGSGARPLCRARAAGEQGVGAVDLVAGGAEVLPDRAEVGAAGDAVFHQPGGLRPVGVGGGAGVDAQLGLQRVADGPGADEADQALGEDR